jgi:hypothetical protein
MNSSSPRRLAATLLVAFVGFLSSGWALADPPSRVARLAYITGDTSFSPGGERDWVRASVNRPMITGDRLWVGEDARAELQLGSAALRVGAGTSLTLLNLDDRTAQVELAQGTLNVRVRRLDRGQVFEIDTPNLAYSIRRPGSYRIDVDPDGTATTVVARTGQAQVYGDGAAFITDAGQTYRFFGSALGDYESYGLLRPDEFDNWSNERDRRWDNSASRRYVSPEMIGYEDLDQYGTWRKTPDYGSVWVPNRVAADWAPYRDGHWAWVEPWGWTWVDEAPWGFAPSHYGRWARVDNDWAWVPGPATARPVYAPALVAFVGGSDLRSSGGASVTVAWFPLGPRDVYRPSYAASRQYFSDVNTSNTGINRTNITNVYNNTNVSNITYVNQQVPGAIVAVPAAAFVQSRPVAKEAVRVNQQMIARAPVVAAVPVAPVHASLVGGQAALAARPPERAQARPVVAQVAPPPPPVPFAAKQGALAANAGKPFDPATVAGLKPAAPVPAPAVKVVKPMQAMVAPPRPASAPAGGAAAFGSAGRSPAPAALQVPSRTGDRGAALGTRPAGPVSPGSAPGPAAVPGAARASAPVTPSPFAAPSAPAARPPAPQAPPARPAAPAVTAPVTPPLIAAPSAPSARPPAPPPPAHPAAPVVKTPVTPPSFAAPPAPAARPAAPVVKTPVAPPPFAAPSAPSARLPVPPPPAHPAAPVVKTPVTPPSFAAPPAPAARPPAPPPPPLARPPAVTAPVTPPPFAAPSAPAARPPAPAAVPPRPPAAAAPLTAPPHAVPAAPPPPAFRAASPAVPAPAAAPEKRGPPKAHEGQAPAKRDAASEAAPPAR